MKVCIKCGVETPLVDFSKLASSRKDGLHYYCRKCKAKIEAAGRKRNSGRTREANRQNYQKHRELRLIYSKEYYSTNSEKRKFYQAEYERERTKTDLNFKLRIRIRTQIRNGICRAGESKGCSTIGIIGVSYEELRCRLEAQFLGGMTWDNWGDVWELGHRKPQASFDLRDLEQQKECWNPNNLFPAFKEKNASDGARYEGVDFKGLRPADFRIGEIPLSEARPLVEDFHYSGAAPSAATLCFGLFDVGNQLIGAAIYRPAPLGSAKQLSPSDPQAVLNLSRFVLAPGMPHNTASFFLSATVREIKKLKRWSLLVTYADTWRGHEGNIYKASNWEYVGLTAPQPVWIVAGKVVSSRGLKFVDKSQAVLQGNFSKHKFIFRFS